LALLLCLLACGSHDESLDRPLDLMAPLALESTLVMVDKAAPQAFLLDTSQDPLPTEPIVAELPHGPTLATRRNDHDEGLVLCLGRRADSEHEEEAASLVALEPNGTLRSYPLGNPFDRMEQSPDGQYAFLFKSKEGTAERLLDNPNEVAVVDLDKQPKDESAVNLRTLRSFGDSPDSVVFSPLMTIAGEERRLAVVLSGTNVTLLDLDHLDHRETTVQLAGNGDAHVTPNQIVFNPGAPELYVRGNASADVFVFNLSPRAGDPMTEDGETRNDFRPFIDQLGVGGNPTDMALYDEDEGGKLLVLSDGRSASVVEASTSQVTSVALPDDARQVLLFNAPSPRDDEAAPRALLYTPGQNTLTFLDLEDLEDAGTRAIDTLELQHPVKSIVPMLEENRVLVLHDGQSVSLVDLAGRTAPPITSTVTLAGALFDSDKQRLWVGPPGQPYAAWFELDTGDTREVLLDHPIGELVPLFDSGRLAIVHDDPLGLITVLDVDGDKPTRDDAREVRGFFAAGLLDRGE
jgi:hypothetical protein